MSDVPQSKLDGTPPLPEPVSEAVSDVASDVTDEKVWIPDDKPPCVTTEQPTVREMIERSQIDMSKVSERLDRVVEEPKGPLLKRDYIRNIKKLTDRFSDRVLQRMRKDQLKETLASLWSDKVSEIGSVSVRREQEQPGPGINAPRMSNEILVGTMYNCTLLVASGIEALTKNFNPWLGGYCLDGYSFELNRPEHKAQLIEILREIQISNAELIEEYCSVESRLCLLFLVCGANSVKHISQVKKHEPQVQQSNLHL